MYFSCFHHESDEEMAEKARKEMDVMICPDEDIMESLKDKANRCWLHRELGEDEEEDFMDLLNVGCFRHYIITYEFSNPLSVTVISIMNNSQQDLKIYNLHALLNCFKK